MGKLHDLVCDSWRVSPDCSRLRQSGMTVNA
jgi:hypothetical protein